MEFKIENARFTNERGTLHNKKDERLTFDVDVTFQGKTMPYTFIDYAYESEEPSVSEIRRYIKSNLHNIKIKNFEKELPIATLSSHQRCFKEDIDKDAEEFISLCDGVYFENDLFEYTLESQNIIGNFISNLTYLIEEGKIKEENAQQEIISMTNERHIFSYKQLKLLFSMMVERYSEVKLHARDLKDKINKSDNIDEIREIVWDLWER